MKILYKIIDWQLHVAICITGLALFFQLIIDVYNPILLLITGIGTFVLYNFSVRDLSKIQAKVKWLLILLLMLVILLALFYLKLSSVMVLGVLFLLSLLYKIPLFGISFREIPFLKLFQIAWVWSFLLVILPFLEGGNSSLPIRLWASNFLFIIAITLPFDYNDIKTDKNNLKTIPMSIGLLPTRILCTGLLIASAYFFYSEITETYFRISWLISIAIAIILCINISPKKTHFYYRFWIESISLIPILVYSLLLLFK